MLGYFETTLIFILIVIVFIIYNILQKNRNNVKISRTNMELSMVKRCQEIPELIEMLKKYSMYDDSILEKFSSLNLEDYSTFSLEKKINIDEKISKVFFKIIDIFEDYSEIKSKQEYLAMKRYLIDIENEVNNNKENYRILSEKYNSQIKVFPNNLVAILFGFNEEIESKVPEKNGKEV